MPQPTLQDSHLDAILTNISVAYFQDESRFIAERVFPTIPVDKKSDKFYKYGKNDWFRDEAQRRADATESAGSGYTLGTDNYSCDVWAFHKDVGNQTVANTDAPLNPYSDAAKFVAGRLLLRREIQFVSDYFATGIWGTDMTGVAAAPGANQFVKWSDYTNSDPIEDVEDGKEKVLSTTGFEPNTLVLGYRVFRRLKHHPVLRELIKYTSSENITTALLSRIFEVDRVLVASAVKATNVEGAPEGYDFVYPDSALLAYVTPTPGLYTPTAGYNFAWTGVSSGLGLPVGTSQIDMPLHKAKRIESEIAFDHKVVGADLGYFFASAV
ncbi:MAG: hypothetical protein ACOYY2_02900 [Actinomycetota bacterium]